MEPIEVHREHMRWSHEFFELVTQDVTPEQVAWQPPGTANPLAAVLAHAVLSEDAAFQILLKDQDPLFAGDWQGRTGISEPDLNITPEWARRVEVDLGQWRQYMKAVFERSREVASELTDEELEGKIDLSELGMEPKTGHEVIAELIVSHLNNMIGEIAVLKGLQGGRGYPF